MWFRQSSIGTARLSLNLARALLECFRMRILWAKSDVLLPLDSGGKLRTWHLLRHLAARHDISFIGFAPPAQSPAAIDAMRTVARTIHVVPRVDVGKGSLRFYADAALHLTDPLPYAVGKYRSRAYRRRVRALLRDQSFDLIVCDFPSPAVNLPLELPAPSVIFTHNVETEIWRRYVATAPRAAARFLYGVQHRRMLRFERHLLGRFDAVLTVSDADRDTFQRLFPGAARGPFFVVPTGVDTAFFASTPSAAAARSLVFTGSMDWLPNEDAMLFFCREVLPLIRREEPDVSLSIVGRSPTPAIRRLGEQPGITVTGRVDDVRPHVEPAAVYVVPLRIGGGTRLKIFEAMAMGRAVVSTSVGAEGLPVRDGEHLLLADDASAFARAVVRLIRDVDRRRALESAARRLVVDRYDWGVAAEELERALVQVAGLRRGSLTVGEAVPRQVMVR